MELISLNAKINKDIWDIFERAVIAKGLGLTGIEALSSYVQLIVKDYGTQEIMAEMNKTIEQRKSEVMQQLAVQLELFKPEYTTVLEIYVPPVEEVI